MTRLTMTAECCRPLHSMSASRREYLKLMLVGATPALTGLEPLLDANAPQSASPPPEHERRIQWWRQVKFGMFVHWGLYSILGRDAWAMGDEDIPLNEYERLASQFQPLPNAPRGWARLAREAGMRYIVLTTKHHEGFCHFNSKLTDYCAPK